MRLSVRILVGILVGSFLVVLRTTTAFSPPQPRKHNEHIQIYRIVLHMSDSSSHQQDYDDSTNPPPRREIGEVVQGLHGGKYQFGHDAASSPLSFEGRQFAETGYSSGENHPTSPNSLENEPLPNWAGRLVEFPLPSTNDPTVHKISVADLMMDDGAEIMISIQNEERSWELYYAFAVGPLSKHVSITPPVGQLAPRGGVQTFSDAATLAVTLHDPKAVEGFATCDDPVNNPSWIIVGTEAEKWFWQLLK